MRDETGLDLKNPWWVAAGSAIGLTVGNGPVMLFTFGIILTPIVDEFGWLRGTVGAAIFLAHVATALATPVVGMLIDRWGIRRVGLVFITFFSFSIAAIALTPASIAIFFLLYAVSGVFAAGQTPMPYAKAVAATFDLKRGIALGVAMAGVGIGTSLIPRWTQFLVDAFGWREAYIGLGITTFVLAFPAVAFLVGQADARLARKHDAAPAAVTLTGIAAHEAVKHYRFWAIGIAAFLFTLAVNGTIGHVVPMLIDRGISAQDAATMMIGVGISTIAGRLLSGFLLDRFFAPYVAVGFFVLPVIGIALLSSGEAGAVPLLAIVFLGLGLGAEVDMVGFMVSRYFGLRAFGEIYGYIFAMFALGSGFGPMALGFAFDLTGTYGVGLTVSTATVITAAGLLLRLGPYAYPALHARLTAEPAVALSR